MPAISLAGNEARDTQSGILRIDAQDARRRLIGSFLRGAPWRCRGGTISLNTSSNALATLLCEPTTAGKPIARRATAKITKMAQGYGVVFPQKRDIERVVL